MSKQGYVTESNTDTHHFVAIKCFVVLLHEELNVSLLGPRLDIFGVQLQSLHGYHGGTSAATTKKARVVGCTHDLIAGILEIPQHDKELQLGYGKNDIQCYHRWRSRTKQENRKH